MIGKVKLLSNYKELEKYNRDIEEYGETEAFNLGLYSTPPKEVFVKNDFLFKMSDMKSVWIIIDKEELTGKAINVKMEDDDIWTFGWDEKLWEKLETYFKEL